MRIPPIAPSLPRTPTMMLVTLCTLMCTEALCGTVHAATREDTPVATAPHKESAKQGNTTKVTAQDLLDLALAQVGITENAQGGGTKFHAWYMSSPRARETAARDGGTVEDYANAPWCAMFVSWVGEQLGIRSTVGWDAYTVTHAQWFRDNGRWGTEPTPGAVVFFAWEGTKNISDIDHVGFVIKDNNDGTISTVEGNTGNGRVETRIRPKAQVVGYGYPEYAP